MKTAIIIPARIGSTRLPGKPLIEVNGKPVIIWLLENLKGANVSDIVVATDSEEIFSIVKKAGFDSVITSKEIRSGSDRVYAVAQSLNVDFIINVQGDEPLFKAEYINDFLNFINSFDENTRFNSVFTMAKYKNSIEEYKDSNIVKVVFDKNKRALYFSRAMIPYYRDNNFKGFYHHYGVYAYSKKLLSKFITLKSKYENYEKLEQLRFLENGYNIYVYEVDFNLIGIDSKEDIEKFKKYLNENK